MSETAVAPLVEKPDVAQEAKDAVKEPSTDVYHNPLESSSRMGLAARVYAYRTGASIAFGMGNMISPAVPFPDQTIYLDSTFSKDYAGKDKIKAEVWTPDRTRSVSRKSSRGSLRSLKKEEKMKKKQKEKTGSSSASTPGGYDDTTDYLRPTLSRTSTGISATDEEANGNTSGSEKKKRPSTLSRLSSRLSTHSSKSLRTAKSRSSVSLPSTPSETAVNPMEQIPSSLHPQADPRSRRPAVINFHGGGFVLGQGTDDGRWGMAVMQALGAVFFSVEYRLAPSYPFPTPVEDCADAILQIRRRADEFWIDPNKIILSGFSAGGTLALASWVLLADHKRWGYTVPPDPSLTDDMSKFTVTAPDGDDSVRDSGTDIGQNEDPTVPRPVGFMLFYPLLDWTMSRPRKRLTCSKPEMTLPRSLTDIFDASYIYPPEELKAQLDNPLLSPGLMPDELIDKLPPVQLCLCEYDMLLAEGKRFAERVQARGKPLGYRVVKEAKHAWDKPPPFSPPESMGVEYAEAVRVMARWLGTEDGNNSGESLVKGDDSSSVQNSVVPENEVV